MIGVLCGAGAALCWAAGFVAAKHGIAAGFAPADLAFHRYVWAGLALLPLVLREGVADLGGIGWTRGITMALLVGPLQAIVSYTGFTLTPFGHGPVIQPAVSMLGGLLLASWVLGETLPTRRLIGALVTVAGLVLLAAEALTTIGTHAVGGDLMFATAGVMWATFGTLLRKWGMAGLRAAVIVSALSLFYVPAHAVLFGFGRMAAAGLAENLLQIVVQGVFAGAGAIYLFGRAVTLLGAGRAAAFPALVPAMTLVIGFLAIGEVPSLVQIAGLVAVALGFRLAL